MIDVARRSTTSEKIVFEVADGSKPKKYRGGEYDLVFAGWLLNYAPSGKDMANMFRNVALNLKDGGHFVVRTTRQNYAWLSYAVRFETQGESNDLCVTPLTYAVPLSKHEDRY